MTKKGYVRPYTMVQNINIAELICASMGVTSDVGIDYGGVDEEGTKTAESRRRYPVWVNNEEDWN